MRFIRNEIQTPKPLVPPEKRKTLPFYILAAGVCVLIVGVAGFFSAFFLHEMIWYQWHVHYRECKPGPFTWLRGCFCISRRVDFKNPAGEDHSFTKYPPS